jgi:hypothetical protein
MPLPDPSHGHAVNAGWSARRREQQGEPGEGQPADACHGRRTVSWTSHAGSIQVVLKGGAGAIGVGGLEPGECQGMDVVTASRRGVATSFHESPSSQKPGMSTMSMPTR